MFVGESFVHVHNARYCVPSFILQIPSFSHLQHFNARVCDLMVLMEERLLFRLIQWIQEGLASTDENMEDNAGKEAFSMLTRR